MACQIEMLIFFQKVADKLGNKLRAGKLSKQEKKKKFISRFT